MMNDLISRQAAYDTLTEYYHHTTEIQHKALREALERVPSAEPEKRTEERTETHACDCIERQAAIKEIKAIFEWHDTVTVERMIEHFNNLPSAQPEVLACGEGELITQPELLKDGTLMIDVPDLDTIHRVIVSSGKKSGMRFISLSRGQSVSWFISRHKRRTANDR